jgi:methylamine--corrinoid protein Co-methyltransferase
MKHRGRLTDNLLRAETGPLIDEKDFDSQVIVPTVKRLVKKYAIKFDKSCIVSSDDDLADRVFQAGMELAVDVGVFCQNTSRRIIWTRQEIEDGIRFCPDEVVFGRGADSVVVRARRPEDNTRLVITGGPIGVSIPEDLYPKIMLSYAKESVIDGVDAPVLESVYGLPIKADSPWEALAGWREAELAHEVLQRSGRLEMSLGCVGLAATEIAQLSAASYGGFRPMDRHYVAMLGEFKTNYHMLTKVVHITRIGGLLQSFYNPIYGGYVGGAEGVAIALAAGPILLNQLYMGSTYGARPEHPFLNCNSTPELLWAMSVAFQGVTKNTNLLLHALAGPAGGPGTRTMLLENAAITICSTVSGVSMIAASMSASGVKPRHASGLDAKICGEVAHATEGMSRKEANLIVSKLLHEYEDDIKNKPFGKPFEEVYDLEKIEPTPEWLGLYNSVKDELTALGVNF